MKDIIREAFKNMVKPGSRHVYIYQIRRKLGDPRGFDDALDALMVDGDCSGYLGDPTSLTADEIRDSFRGRDGELYIAVHCK